MSSRNQHDGLQRLSDADALRNALEASGLEWLAGKGGVWIHGEKHYRYDEIRSRLGLPKPPVRVRNERVSAYGDWAWVAAINNASSRNQQQETSKMKTSNVVCIMRQDGYGALRVAQHLTAAQADATAELLTSTLALLGVGVRLDNGTWMPYIACAAVGGCK